jgi:hypothetical protein
VNQALVREAGGVAVPAGTVFSRWKSAYLSWIDSLGVMAAAKAMSHSWPRFAPVRWSSKSW